MTTENRNTLPKLDPTLDLSQQQSFIYKAIADYCGLKYNEDGFLTSELGVEILFTLRHKEILVINSFFVHWDQRGNGVATKLLVKLLDVCDYYGLCLETDFAPSDEVHSDRLLKFLERLGFRFMTGSILFRVPNTYLFGGIKKPNTMNAFSETNNLGMTPEGLKEVLTRTFKDITEEDKSRLLDYFNSFKGFDKVFEETINSIVPYRESFSRWFNFGNSRGSLVRVIPKRIDVPESEIPEVLAETVTAFFSENKENDAVIFNIVSSQFNYPIVENYEDEMSWDDAYTLSERLVYTKYPRKLDYMSKEWIEFMTFRSILDQTPINLSYSTTRKRSREILVPVRPSMHRLIVIEQALKRDLLLDNVTEDLNLTREDIELLIRNARFIG